MRNGINISNSTPGYTYITEHNNASQQVVTGLMVDNTTVGDNGTMFTCSPNDANHMNLTSTAILNITGIHCMVNTKFM